MPPHAKLPTPITAPALALPGIAHGFFTREGGVSKGIFASLNCGLGSGDRRGDVIENRRRVTEALGARHLMTLYQAHTPTALVLDEPVDISELPKADALVTRTRGLAIGVLAADCAPVLFVDGEATVVAAAHAGWRGALAGVLEATVGAMQAEGARRERIVAVVGPCISQAAYEVGPEFEAEFLAKDAGSQRFFSVPVDGGRPHFDLSGFVAARLTAAGLAKVETIDLCTYTSESSFSYRRSQRRKEPDYGRQISAIVVT